MAGPDFSSSSVFFKHASGSRRPSQARWPAPARRRLSTITRAVASASAPAPSSSSPSAAAAAAARPGSPSTAGGANASPGYFAGFCEGGECSVLWEQLRWVASWRQMRTMYDNLLRAEAEAAAAAAAAAMAAQVAAAMHSGGGGASATAGGNNYSGSSSSTNASMSMDVTAAAVAAAAAAGASPVASVDGGAPAGRRDRSAPGLLGLDDTYAFLLQLQDFYHLRQDESDLQEMQDFRCRLVRDMSMYVRRMDAEQLEALCCASAVSGKCLTRERADAVQERLLRILNHSSNGGGNGHNGNGSSKSSSSGAFAGLGPYAGRRRPAGSDVGGGFQVLTPALNTIFALYDHGYLPQVALLQAVFRQAVDHTGEVTRTQWHALQGLARRFRFMVDDMWLEDLHAALRDPLACTPDFGRMSCILGCISAFIVNKAMEPLDTRVLVVVEAIERRYDEGRSLLNAHQLCVFAALLWDMRSPFRTKWLGICLDHLASCRSHLAGVSPATLVLAVELVLRGRGWEETRLLSKLLRQLFSTYAGHPSGGLAARASANVSGCPPRAASRIIASGNGPGISSSTTATTANGNGGSSGSAAGNGGLSNGAANGNGGSAAAAAAAAAASQPSSAFTTGPPTLAAMAAAAAWDVEVGGGGGAASPPHDLVTLVDWLASKVPSSPGPERTDTLELLQPLVAELVEGGRQQLAELEPRRIPPLIKAVAVLGYSPSRQWVAEAFAHVAGGADSLSGAELVAMLRVSHAQRLPLPHATLDAVCAQHSRILPLMRAVDLQRLLECWVADRYIPSKDQLEGFFDAVCDSFGIDLAALKAAAAAPPPGPNGSVSLAAAAAATGSTGSASGSVQSLDSAVSASAASAASMGSMDVIGSGTAGASGSGSGSGGLPRPSFFLDAEAMRSVSGGTGISDGVAGGFGAAAAAQPPQPPPPPATAAALSAAAAAATAAAAANVAASRAAAAAAARREEAAAEPPPTPSSLAAARAKAASLGSLDTRPKGSLLQPSEAQSMLTLLDQYRGLLLEAKRSDLLITMNTYRNAVTAALHDMRRKEAAAAAAAAAAGGGAAGLGGAAGGVGAVASGKVPPSAKLLQAVLRGGAGVTPPPPEPVM
ncbi:hypothetical protein CHLRE_13g588000v5 [Chlamydomonas reinhardtii]|uniref:Uncharacterized protein n=1 Tax=Chlamydomonas reinhardtii TaxID=3055 RepID=A0A2K3D0W7_CHLRE|nr:uncharacterized protein CHLRE_13g588000v5 [Chlamydomonas reinhardtii]PNW74167.1 hypothetical protein CHLRE_13g588000v5 [Chlamydomonas reinhardtii]